MTTPELRDPAEIRRWALQGLWLQRAAPVTPAAAGDALPWIYELASSGEPVPPPGFVADLGQVAFSHDNPLGGPGPKSAAHAGLPPGLLRTYEDYVLGKLYADSSFERGADALARYQGRDRVRGLAYLITQFQKRAGFGGILLNPAVLKTLLQQPAEELLREGQASLHRDGLLPMLQQGYEQLVSHVRTVGEVLGPEDIFELEHGTALAQFGQRFALRQVLQAANWFHEHLPAQPPHKVARRYDVPTQILDEDTYPIGGYTSIATRGSIESILQSQLAYMEPTEAPRPDLFDMKFLREELLYYSRDENTFLRRRQRFVFALWPELAETRVKDAGLPFQRLILLLGLLVTVVRKLIDWLSTDALSFEFVLLERGANLTELAQPEVLASEAELLQMLFQEQIASGVVTVRAGRPEDLPTEADEHARRGVCHVVSISPGDEDFETERAIVGRLSVSHARPLVGWPHEQLGPAAEVHEEDPAAAWAATAELILEQWA